MHGFINRNLKQTETLLSFDDIFSKNEVSDRVEFARESVGPYCGNNVINTSG